MKQNEIGFKRYLAIGLLMAASVTANAIAPSGGESSIVITQSVTGPTEGVVSTTIARRGTARGNGTAMSMDIGASKLDASTGIPQVAIVNYGTTLTRSQLTTQAHDNIVGINYPTAAGAVAPLVAAMKSYMSAQGAALAVFNFNQKVIVTGDANPKYLIWSVMLRDGQQAIFPNPKVVDNIPTILQAVYTPLAVAKGLPSTWAYPNAGTIQWRKLDAAYNPISPWTTVNVGGAFDQPEDLSGAAVDKDWGVKCLVKRNSSPTCPSTTNVADIMDQVGSGYAMLDYGRTLQPVYDAVENPPGSGQYDQVAHVAMSIDTRELNMSSCSNGTYTNKGTYGFELHNQVDRYAVWGDGTYKLLNSFTSNTISATTPFEVTKSGLVGATISSLADKIINPSDTAGPLLLASSVPNLLNLAPITVVSNAQPTRAIGVYYYGSCGRSFGVESQCDANGNIKLKFGVSGQVPGCAWGTDFYEAQTYSLTPGSPTGWKTSVLDYAGTFTWRYDGDHSIIFQHVDGAMSSGPSAPANMSIFATQMFFPNMGYYIKENFPAGGPLGFYFEKGICPAGSTGGDQLFAPDAEGYSSLISQCFAPNENGGYAACSDVSCNTYGIVGPKSWGITQQ